MAKTCTLPLVSLALQEDGFQGALATRIAESAVRELVTLGHLPSTCLHLRRGTHPLLLPMFLPRETLVGRELEVARVKERLVECRSGLLWGGPGEGKTSLARAVGAVGYDQGLFPAGVFEVDLQGKWCSLGWMMCAWRLVRRLGRDARSVATLTAV